MRRNTVIFNQLSLNLGIDIPFAGLISAKVTENKLCATLSIIFVIIFGNHLGAVRSLVVRIIFIRRRNHAHIQCHLTGIVRGDEHLCLSLSFRQRFTPQYCGVAALCKLHQLLDKFLLLWRRRDIVQYLVLCRTVNTNIFCGLIVRYLIIESRKFRHLDKVAETLLCHDIVRYVKLIVGGFLCEDSSPRVKTPDVLSFKFFRTQIFEQQVKFSQRITDCSTRQECRAKVFAIPFLNGSDSIEKIERTLGAFRIAQSGNTVVTGVEHQIFELMALVNENVVYAHLPEINDAVLVLLHLVLERFKFGGQVLLTLDKPFEHTA